MQRQKYAFNVWGQKTHPLVAYHMTVLMYLVLMSFQVNCHSSALY